MSSSSDEISVTLATLTGQSESISVSHTTTTLNELCDFAIALLGLPPSNPIALNKDGKALLVRSAGQGGEVVGRTVLKDAGVTNGDLILVTGAKTGGGGGVGGGGNARGQVSAPTPAPSAGGGGGGSGGGLGGLDFSSLLGSSSSAATPAPAPRASSGPTTTAQSSNQQQQQQQLSFHLPGLESAVAAASSSSQQGVEWDGMTLDDVLARNPNPNQLIPILLNTERHPNLMKELNHHSPGLAGKIRVAGLKDGPRVWREEMMKGSIDRAFHTTMTKRKELEMRDRLRVNPLDEEANKYFGEKIQMENVEAQYREMMEEYPESMGRVLMLYIDAEVNSHPIQAFVDSGAQNTIMSSRCAERCGLLHLLDTRFEGTAVGVGTGKILGRVHITPLKIKGHFFPCSITVMDSEKGLGDKNMDFLFGLDMLKRHRCKIDLETNALVFSMGDGRYMEAPFLHEKDLDETKGGTKGFDADKSNAELARAMEEAGAKKKKARGGGGEGGDGEVDGDKSHGNENGEESGYDGGVESESMDVDEGGDDKGKKKTGDRK